MTYIVKADIPSCNGASCRICQDYLPGFFDKDGGIRVVDENSEIDGAEMAAQFCPTQCIEMEAVRDDT